MSLFTKTKSVEELEEDRDRLVVEEEVATSRASVAEKEAIIRQLKREYGPRWKSFLGLKGLVDIQTLRSMLAKMKGGLKGAGNALHNPSINPLPPRRLRR